jgi:hypothetical protein
MSWWWWWCRWCRGIGRSGRDRRRGVCSGRRRCRGRAGGVSADGAWKTAAAVGERGEAAAAAGRVERRLSRLSRQEGWGLIESRQRVMRDELV